MISKLWSGKALAMTAAVAAGVVLLALASFSVASPEQVSSGALGPDWQCSRVALVLTTCTRTTETEGRVIPVQAKEDCPPEP